MRGRSEWFVVHQCSLRVNAALVSECCFSRKGALWRSRRLTIHWGTLGPAVGEQAAAVRNPAPAASGAALLEP